eukprot:PLAT15928.1.p1 GENE.PLAT15928.1~~PLAT15928.1.p1  ORF type:complete len:191 (-),score=42.76 PLAT15928.1:20-592(-)
MLRAARVPARRWTFYSHTDWFPSWVDELSEREGVRMLPNGGEKKGKMADGNLLDHLCRYDLLQQQLFWQSEGKMIHAALWLPKEAQGHPGLVHGGMTATILDQLTGAAFVHSGHSPGFTANMTTDYRAPLPVPSTIAGSAWVHSVDGRKVWLRSELRSAPEWMGGTLLAESSVLYVKMDKDTYQTALQAK